MPGDFKDTLFISFDNVAVGRLIGEAMVRAQARGNWVLIEADPMIAIVDLFRQGQMQAVQPLVDKGDIKIVAQQGIENWKPDVAQTTMDQILTKVGNDVRGYFIVEGVFTPDEVAEMRSEWKRLRGIEGELGGHEVHIEPGAPRLSNLFNKSPAFDRLLRCAPTLAAAHYLLGEIRVFSLNGRNPIKGEGQQLLHSDVPRLHGTDWRIVNSMVMLDDMTEDNGPTRVVPGSHKWVPINVPDVNMFDVKEVVVTAEDRKIMPADPKAPHPKEIHLTGKAGSVGVINGHIWHGGTVNRSGNPRRVLHLAIGRRDLPEQLNEREHLTPELLNRSSPAQRYLLDIEGAEPKVFGYPPLPKEVRTWTAVEAVDARH